MQFSYQSLLDEIEELTLQLNKQNDALNFAIKQRDGDASKISQLKAESDRIQEQAEKSEHVARTLTTKFPSSNSGNSKSSSIPSTSLASMSAGDLLKKTYFSNDDDDESETRNPNSPQSQSFRGLQKLSQQRNQQSSAASFALEHARANSFQARLHAVDRQKGKALESVVNLMNENANHKISSSKKNISNNNNHASCNSFWGPRAMTAFAASPTSKKHLVSCDVVDDAFKRGVACWLDWCEGKLQECIVNSSRSFENRDYDDSQNDDVDERKRISALFKSLLVSSQFVAGTRKKNQDVDGEENDDVAFNLGLACGEDLKLCRRIFASPSDSETFSVADRARLFFESMTTSIDDDGTEGENSFDWPKVV